MSVVEGEGVVGGVVGDIRILGVAHVYGRTMSVYCDGLGGDVQLGEVEAGIGGVHNLAVTIIFTALGDNNTDFIYIAGDTCNRILRNA